MKMEDGFSFIAFLQRVLSVGITSDSLKRNKKKKKRRETDEVR